ncbi:MAG: MATE family efflux transporter [Clostridiales bacterium]|nr:MATE family efflux transporter [Clostridiales bacterium]
MKKSFYHYVLPSMLAFAFSGLYSIVDGLFIGRTLGDAGLSAINFSYPLVVLIQATGTGIGLGGSVGISMSIGQNNKKLTNRYVGNSLTLLVLSCVILTFVLAMFSQPVLVAFGAKGNILSYGKEYLHWIILGASFQIIANGLAPILRNFGRPTLVMLAMVGGFLTNIFLDWLFVPVLGFGMKGAAIATVLGQLITLLPCILPLVRILRPFSFNHYLLRSSLIMNILRTGLSPFGLAVAPYIILILMNKACVVYGGEKAIAAYSVISYIVSFMQLILQGIGDGCQPLISLYLGQEKKQEAIKTRNFAYKFSFFVATAYALFIFLFRRQVPVLFGSSTEVGALVAAVLPLFCVTFLLYSFSRITTSYFYATMQNRLSFLTIYGEPVLVFLLLQYLLAPTLGLKGVWLSVPVAQFAVFLLGVFFIKKEGRVKKFSNAA